MPHGIDELLEALQQGALPAVCFEPDGRIRTDAPVRQLILPGSFNPLHHGHRELARVASQETGLAPAFELSVVHVDKPPLTEAEVRRRAQQFEWFAPLWVTHAPRFEQKAALFPEAIFVLGADTASRLIDPTYYAQDLGKLRDSLARIRQQGCRILVAGRHDDAGVLLELEHLAVPPDFADLFTPISRTSFAVRVSSSALRAVSPSPLAGEARKLD